MSGRPSNPVWSAPPWTRSRRSSWPPSRKLCTGWRELAAAGEPFIEADAEFHRRLFEPLNNELLISLMDVFWKVYRRIHLEVGGPYAVDLQEPAALHRGIYEAVASADKALAAERLSTHFEGIRDIIAQTTRLITGRSRDRCRASAAGLKQKIRPGEPGRIFFICAPKGIRTPDLLFRRQTLYPAELWAHSRLLENFSLPEPRITLREAGPVTNRNGCNVARLDRSM